MRDIGDNDAELAALGRMEWFIERTVQILHTYELGLDVEQERRAITQITKSFYVEGIDLCEKNAQQLASAIGGLIV